MCVDLASLMRPGEGMLVGSFSRGLFLVRVDCMADRFIHCDIHCDILIESCQVHSECEESAYINSRPFRVNAGPVHAYVHTTGDYCIFDDPDSLRVFGSPSVCSD